MRSGSLRPERLAAALVALLVAGQALAAVDVNRADLASLESVRGVGTVLAAAIVYERARAPFRDWADLLARIKGIGAASAARLSAAGLTVDGTSFEAAARPHSGTDRARRAPD